MTERSKDRAWLQRLLTTLLEDAAKYDEESGTVMQPDHGPCSKYAELLLKILPSNVGAEKTGSSVVESVRQSLALERTQLAEKRNDG